MLKDTNYHFNSDCMDVLKDIPDNTINLVFTDPPYNISEKNKIFRDYRNGKNGDIRMDFGEWDYSFAPEPFLKEIKRVLDDSGSIVVWTSEQLYPVYHNWFNENMHVKQLLVWVKSNPLPQFRMCGYRQTTELMIWASKNPIGKNNPNFIFQSQEEMTNVFHAPIVSGKNRTEHPTQKPLSITEQIIKTHCREGGMVLDPFSGSGTVGVACLKLGRHYYMIEKEKKWFDIAENRLKNTRPKEKSNIFNEIT